MNPAANMLEWQKNVAEFLSSRRKYRVFSWECGPTLLDELHCKRQYELDYIKIGIAYTPIIAMSAGLISLIITRKAGFAGVVTSGLILFGIVATLTIDYQMTRRKGGEVSEKECVELLQELEKMPQHWWWPWSKSRGEKGEVYIEKLSYLYNYYELGGEMGKVSDMINNAYQRLPRLRSSGSEVQIAEEAYSEKREVEETGTISKLVKAIYKCENEEMRLRHALEKLNFAWLLLHLDESVIGVREKRKSEEEHNKYFESMIKQMQKLSFTYHPDKQKSGDDQAQKIINQTVGALRIIHKQIMKMGNINDTEFKATLMSSYIEKQECYFIYRMYGDIPLDILSSREDVSGVVKTSQFDGTSVLFELYSLANQEEGELMMARNMYLSDVASFVRSFSKKLSSITTAQYNELDIIKGNIKLTREKFDEAYDSYVKRYEIDWIKYLERFNEQCQRSELLEIIRPEVKKLLKASYKQYEILLNKSYNVEADESFVLPMLEYHVWLKVYHEFAIQLLEETKSCYNYTWAFCMSKKGYRDIWKRDESALKKISFVLAKDREETKFLEKAKEKIRNNLCRRELICDAKKLVSAYTNHDENGLRERISKYYQKSNEPTKEEIGNIILFMLEYIGELLSNEFKEKKTYFERQKETLERLKKEIEENTNARLEIEQENRKLEQAKHTSDQRAEQESQRAEQSTKIGQMFTEMILYSDMDNKLKKIVINNHVKIVKEVAKHVMEHNSSPELLLNEMMG